MDREDRLETVYHCRKFASLTVGFHFSLIKIRFVKLAILFKWFLSSGFLVEVLLVNSWLNGDEMNQFFFCEKVNETPGICRKSSSNKKPSSSETQFNVINGIVFCFKLVAATDKT